MRVSRYQRGYRFLPGLRAYLRDSILFAPLMGLALGSLLATLMINAEVALNEAGVSPDLFKNLGQGAQAAIGTMASAMLTFVGVVFSISLVALQMASNFSPRVVRLYVRSKITKLTLAQCLATFIYTLRVQKEVVGNGTGTTPTENLSSYIAATVAMGMVVATLVMFVFYVNNTITLMRITFVIVRVAKETNKAFDYYLNAETKHEVTSALPPQTDVIAFHGKPGVLRDIYTAGFVRNARRADVTLRLLVRIGDPTIEGMPLVAVHGTPRTTVVAAGWKRLVNQCVHSGQERSMNQDLSFGLRQLVDIAAKALSPAVNDPTTAVQSIDRIHVLMRRLAVVELNDAAYADRRRRIRLVVPVPTWDELVALAFTEVRVYGACQPQVTRRIAAALKDLLAVAGVDKQGALLEQRRLLTESVLGVVDRDEVGREFALRADPQGIR
jgi:uncharacterized membrane protein